MLLLAGCGGGLSVVAHVPRPAEVPARAFPVVWLVPLGDEEARALARLARDHLAGDDASRDVTLSDRHAVEARRAEGRLPPAALVVELALRLVAEPSLGFSQRTDPCMAYSADGPCVSSQRRVLSEAVMIRAQLAVDARDAQSGELLQRVVLEEHEEAPSPLDELTARLQVLSRLGTRLLALFDAARDEIRVELVALDDPRGQEALRIARDGRWGEARARLVELASAAEQERWPDAQRAAVLFDLGQARRLDTSDRLPILERLDRAAAILADALRLHPDERTARALEQLRAQRDAHQLAAEQAAAAAHNFALDAEAPLETPHVPEGYPEVLPDPDAPL